MIDTIFINTSIILSLTIGIAFIVQLLKQPLIISYIITGILVGPVFLNIMHSDQEYFHIFAEFGVILLLFLVGLSLNFQFLKKIGKVAAVTGIGQVIFTSIFGFFILTILGFELKFAIFLAIAMTFSSTIIIMKLLSEKRETETVYGRYTIGLMLVQDIIAILLLILLPALKTDSSIFISILIVLLKSTLFLIFISLVSKIILLLLNKAAKSGEFLLIFTIAWCFAIAGLAEWIGLSLEVGAIVAGLALGSSVYQSEISSRIKPLRDFFIVLFFIILGSEMNITSLSEVVVPGIILSLFVLIGNPFVLYSLYRLMKFNRRVSFKAGLTAAQVSEFGFVFIFLVNQHDLIDGDMLPIFTFVALTTIFISSYLIMYNNTIFRKLEPIFNKFGKDKHNSKEEKPKKFDVIVFGYHRLGWKICKTLEELNLSYAVVDYNPLSVKRLRERGMNYYFGDATDVELLDELPLTKAKMIISTMPHAPSQVTMIKHVREENPKALIIANLSYSKFLDDVYDAGADYVMMPHLVCGEWMTNILKTEKINKTLLKKLVKLQEDEIQMKDFIQD